MDKAKRRRAAKRAVFNDVMNKLNNILVDDFDGSSVAEVAGYGDSITALAEEIKKYDGDIFEQIVEEKGKSRVVRTEFPA